MENVMYRTTQFIVDKFMQGPEWFPENFCEEWDQGSEQYRTDSENKSVSRQSPWESLLDHYILAALSFDCGQEIVQLSSCQTLQPNHIFSYFHQKAAAHRGGVEKKSRFPYLFVAFHINSDIVETTLARVPSESSEVE